MWRPQEGRTTKLYFVFLFRVCDMCVKASSSVCMRPGPEGAARRGAPEGFLLLLCEAVRVDRASRRVDHTGGVSAKWR